MRSLSAKLILAFLVVALSGVAMVALVGVYSTQREFGRYLTNQYSDTATDALAFYYSEHGTWEGVESVFPVQRSLFHPGPGPSPRGPMGLSLFDASGALVFRGNGQTPGQVLRDPSREGANPIKVNGDIVGWVVLRGNPFRETLADNAFLNRVNQAVYISAAGAAVFALLLGVILARTLTRQLKVLTFATRAIADGDYEFVVPVRSDDELGRLAESFNTMSRQLSESQNQRRQMTADIAHELRTPISVILGHADAVHDHVLPPSNETFEVIRDEALRLDRMVDDLRTLSRADAGELTVHPQDVDPATALDGAAAAHQPGAQSMGVEIRVDVAPDLPRIHVDPDRMAQVLGNLVTNALRYSPAGGVVSLIGKMEAGDVVIGVRDYGSGIEAQDLPHIFDRFYRTDKSRQRESGGSGLGLAIAKSLVEIQGGRIWAESTPGEGATLWMSFPPIQDPRGMPAPG
jgi:two-component system sensor histidine kinase BaeS